jgi:cell division protein FtsZ
MKGAKGLLISITGGKDLTLYEVDEAATRIREEVDHDANIIVGATFDESLDGIVRVSVVATGIDVATSAVKPAPATIRPAQAVPAAPPATAQAAAAAARLAELSQNLRAVTPPAQRPAAPAPDRSEQAHRAVAEALSVPGVPQAPAATAIEDVTISRIPPKPTLFLEPVEDQTPAPRPPALEKPFIPPQAERVAQRPVRMPPIEEFPIPAQKQVEAKRGEAEEGASPEKRRLSLLQRLASVGLGGRKDEAVSPERREPPRPVAARPAAPPMPKAPPMPPMAPAPRAPEGVADYVKQRPVPRPAPQGLDVHGRPAPVNNSVEDDQLEIPAFLRRQAN